MNPANTFLSLGPSPSGIRAPSIGPGGFGGFDDRVVARFENAADDAFWGADSCGFAGPPGSTVGEECEELELQGSHPIFPSNGQVADSKIPVTWTCATFCHGRWSHIQVRRITGPVVYRTGSVLAEGSGVWHGDFGDLVQEIEAFGPTLPRCWHEILRTHPTHDVTRFIWKGKIVHAYAVNCKLDSLNNSKNVSEAKKEVNREYIPT